MKKKEEDENTGFPVSRTNVVNGSRRLVREKVMQILVSHYVSNTPIDTIFEHIFYRNFNVEEMIYSSDDVGAVKVRSDEELTDMLADATIHWKDGEVEFGKHLIDSVLKHYDDVLAKLVSISDNWDVSRMPMIDRTIIVMAASEMSDFPSIPKDVSINEAVELAKKYSTDKSHTFVNGILDKIKQDL
ncbi:MAG: transcription antitermination factor NusB [Ignavibacteria bacterium]|jgi:N utilization substance protein B|nr:transcription antitermination factor NusB [Ignavibacteria bacterium]